MKTIKIGTRQSPLALWQANKVASILEAKGHPTEIVPITSEGDTNLKQPIYSLGLTGVFTRSLDIALLNDQVDIAVHSLKDVPTILPETLELIAYPERASSADILVYKSEDIFKKEHRIIATGSLRRKAFWNHKYPNDTIVDLRGNVQLRLQKLQDNQDWDGAVFAFAGLDRSEILDELAAKGLHYKVIDWMIAAPSQGILGIVAKEGFDLSDINNPQCELFATVERQFLNVLEGGCTAPIGALVEKIDEENYSFKGAILSIDGQEMISIERQFKANEYLTKGREFAEECIAQGAGKMIEQIKKEIGTK
ncbi:hydroxymethylbilane synthase [Empedobacter stercoris]|uniref:hydroxymethylbilane synthase n=1 Tax=Empedobacter stercoris TaxID=1628248 RepID=UPI0021AF7111|nr:hydroxymethylbilane synthase [Empedobacter stercoris]UWX68052.1 hydroxymethylbilane synthase [Empedobacter stercoris]